MAFHDAVTNALANIGRGIASAKSTQAGTAPSLVDQLKQLRDNQSNNFNTDRFGSKPQAGTNQARNAQNEEKSQNNSLIDLNNSQMDQYPAPEDNLTVIHQGTVIEPEQKESSDAYAPGFSSGGQLNKTSSGGFLDAIARGFANLGLVQQNTSIPSETDLENQGLMAKNEGVPIVTDTAKAKETLDQGLESSLNQTIGKEDAPDAGTSIMVDPLAKAVEDFYGVDVPDDYILKDDNGKAILPDADHEWDTVRALLRGYAANNGMDADELLGRYNTLTDFQMNGTEDEWRSVMLDPRVFGNYTYLLNQYVPEDQRQYVLDNYQNLSSDDQLRQIAEAAFKNMWDTQKQWSMEDFIGGNGNSYTQDRYQHTFSPASILSLAGWAANNGYGPGLTGSEFNDVINAEDGNPRILNVTLDDWFNNANGDIDAQQGGRYNQAVQNLYASSGASGEETGGITGEEAAEANRRMLEYILGAVYLDGDATDAAMRAERAGNNWVDQVFSMDPNKYFSPEFAQTTQGQQLAAEGRIYDQYGDKSFAEQNPFFGNNDYVGTETIGQLQNGLPITMGPLGSRYLDLDALADYGVPIVGVDQIMKNIGWYRGDKDIDRKM